MRPVSTKELPAARVPEMHQTRKRTFFGMKAQLLTCTVTGPHRCGTAAMSMTHPAARCCMVRNLAFAIPVIKRGQSPTQGDVPGTLPCVPGNVAFLGNNLPIDRLTQKIEAAQSSLQPS